MSTLTLILVSLGISLLLHFVIIGIYILACCLAYGFEAETYSSYADMLINNAEDVSEGGTDA